MQINFSNKKNVISLIILTIFVIIIVVLGIRFISGEDNWICENGEWVKHGHPTSNKPDRPCSGFDQTESPTQEDVVIFYPKIDEKVQSPLRIDGKARGNWFFEAVFPVVLVDLEGRQIAAANAKAMDDWMTEGYVPFKVDLEFNIEKELPAKIIFKKDNPSGLPENDAEIEFPIILTANK